MCPLPPYPNQKFLNSANSIAGTKSLRRLAAGFPPRRPRSSPGGICGGQSGAKAGFLRVLLFPLPILIPPTAPHSTSIIQGWYNRSISGRRTKWTSVAQHSKQRKKNLVPKSQDRCE
jgi:hypothetical protein